jgi:hypothetical protein
MIALPYQIVDRALALISALRMTIESSPPIAAKGLASKLEFNGAHLISVSALRELEESLAGAEEIPLIEDLCIRERSRSIRPARRAAPMMAAPRIVITSLRPGRRGAITIAKAFANTPNFICAFGARKRILAG